MKQGIGLAREGAAAVYKRASQGAKGWEIALVLAVFVYAGANFVYVLGQTFDGEPTKLGPNHFAVVDDGLRIRDISVEEYLRRKKLEVRLFSGHAAFFSLLPFLYFGSTRSVARDAG